MSTWFYRNSEDREIGPVGPTAMLELIRAGDILEDTLVRKGNSPWKRSVEINGLWAAAGRPNAEFWCPVCRTNLPKPPCRCPNCMKYIDRAVGKIAKPAVTATQKQRIMTAAAASKLTVEQPSRPIPRHATVENALLNEKIPRERHSDRAVPHLQLAKPRRRWWQSLFRR